MCQVKSACGVRAEVEAMRVPKRHSLVFTFLLLHCSTFFGGVLEADVVLNGRVVLGSYVEILRRKLRSSG